MRVFLAVAALLALTHAAPITQTLEVDSNGIVGSVTSPLVSIVVNILNDSQSPAVIPGVVNEPVVEAEPVTVVDTPALVDPVIVVDTPAIAPQHVVVVDGPAETNPIDVISIIPIVIDPSPIDVIPVSPIVVEPNPIDVISVSPVEPNPIDIISVNPIIVDPSPVDVAPVEPQPVQVVDVTPGLASVDSDAGGTQIINVIMNFVFGSDGTVSSLELPAQPVSQLVGVARG